MSDDTELSRPFSPPGRTRPVTNVDGGDLATYKLREVLGRGGMGQVVVAHDPRIGRDVALKRLTAASPSAVDLERFVREAKIQARLEHPAIVPVHEIGTDAHGMPYFTMKRLAGRTMMELMASGDASKPRLVRALIDVCNAIGLAHSRRVVHRDLKPSNVMLGDYGEVYVIDWGVARMLEEDELVDKDAGPSSISGDLTAAGVVLGTPSYMSPEQLRGEPVGPATDVYAIGAILFEILSGEKLRGGARDDAATSRDAPGELAPIDPSPARRRPDLGIAPELDAACRAALADFPTERPTARELGDRIQRYLDGDRDLELRRKLAVELLAEARGALASEDPARRGDAVRAAGRALALDPESAAAKLVTSMLVTPPATLPDDASTALRELEVRSTALNGIRAVYAYVAFVVFLTVTSFIVPIKNPVQLGVLFAAIVANMVMSRYWIKATGWLELTLTFLLVLAFSRVCGPFILTPVLACAMLPALSQIPWVTERRWILVGWAVACGIGPFALEWLGTVSATWWGTGQGIVSSSSVFDQTTAVGVDVTMIAEIAFLVVVSLYMRELAADRRAAVKQVHVQNWHLRQLL